MYRYVSKVAPALVCSGESMAVNLINGHLQFFLFDEIFSVESDE